MFRARMFMVAVVLALAALSLSAIPAIAVDGPCCYSIPTPAQGE